MEVVANQAHFRVPTAITEWEEFYEPLPFIFFGLFILWTSLLGIWTFNTWRKRRWQTSNLQWALTAVPALKSLVVGDLSFAFWYSCLNLSTCSFWIAFGAFVTRIFFETSCFVSFLLISHGYCIMHEQLSVSERRSIAGLASVLYLTLTGYKADAPQFAVLLVLIYLVVLYVIFLRISRNLLSLQVQLQHIRDEGIHIMHTAVYTKYMMFKKFQGVMLVMIFVEVLAHQKLVERMHAKGDGVANHDWILRSLVQEWTEIGILIYVGWIFRSRDIPPYFSVVPSMHFISESSLPPPYTRLQSHLMTMNIQEMNEKEFSEVDFRDWHIGVPTSLEKREDYHLPMVVLIQNPGISDMQDNLASRQHAANSFQFEKSNLGSCTGMISASLSRHGSGAADSTDMHKMSSSEDCDWKRKIINCNTVGHHEGKIRCSL